jgi:hypothetical protein
LAYPRTATPPPAVAALIPTAYQTLAYTEDLALSHFRWRRSVASPEKDPATKKFEADAPEHLPFQHFRLVVDAFGAAFVVPERDVRVFTSRGSGSQSWTCNRSMDFATGWQERGERAGSNETGD